VVDDASLQTGSIVSGWLLFVTVPTLFTVNSTADTDDGVCDATNCTLREAINAAGNDDLINFSSLFNTPPTINLLSVLPDITKSVTIQGPGANVLALRFRLPLQGQARRPRKQQQFACSCRFAVLVAFRRLKRYRSFT
jgi:CSLREA domain-containing protein